MSAIRPNQEVCIYVSALPFSRAGEPESESVLQREGENQSQEAESLVAVFWTIVLNGYFVFNDLLLVRFCE